MKIEDFITTKYNILLSQLKIKPDEGASPYGSFASEQGLVEADYNEEMATGYIPSAYNETPAADPTQDRPTGMSTTQGNRPAGDTRSAARSSSPATGQKKGYDATGKKKTKKKGKVNMPAGIPGGSTGGLY
ncbi:MAG: hypothetical protein GOVbin630_78 [Prokaryotic dsDNA virus sp.]|nr:MAG: hypothetical protein GOVbin630_78 [Prokaryotic dsDNA virus sp.]|tara:strand:- start:8622 stop:9014 length:393 start_codon:yes stop_codon:yes gene_type:complete